MKKLYSSPTFLTGMAVLLEILNRCGIKYTDAELNDICTDCTRLDFRIGELGKNTQRHHRIYARFDWVFWKTYP